MQVSNIINLRIADIVNDHLFLLIKFYKVELKSVLSCAIVKTYFFVSKAFFALPVYLSIRNVVVRVRKQKQVHYPNHFPSVVQLGRPPKYGVPFTVVSLNPL